MTNPLRIAALAVLLISSSIAAAAGKDGGALDPSDSAVKFACMGALAAPSTTWARPIPDELDVYREDDKSTATCRVAADVQDGASEPALALYFVNVRLADLKVQAVTQVLNNEARQLVARSCASGG